MIRFALPIFLGALLVFLVQPILGKIVLPWFGGISSVWITCLLFFQVALLAGYAYAHAIARAGIRGAWLHAALLAGSLLLLPVHPAASWRPIAGEEPVLSLLLLLGATAGLPFVLLGATSPLLQHWFRRTFPDRSPYRLYALSNVGSLLALLAYPVLVEPALTSRAQTTFWAVAYAVFVALTIACAVRCARGMGRLEPPAPDEPDEDRPTPGRVALWLGLSACGALLLLAITNQVCQEVAVVPFLWVLPLAIYLLTFILCFDHERWYARKVFGPLLVLATPLFCYALHRGVRLDVRWQVPIYALALFAACMVCHGELVRAKPRPRHLTRFYLAVAAGGASGGVLGAVVAPLVFDGYWELHLAFFAACVLGAACWLRARGPSSRPRWWLAFLPILAWLAGLAVALGLHVKDFGEDVIEASRNFYGVLRVRDLRSRTYGHWHSLVHGAIKHGAQFTDPERRDWPTSYFAPESGVGLAVAHHPRRARGGLTIGAVGLGTGTIAALGRPGDRVVFYEINPEVERLARTRFTFLEDSKAEVEVVQGDARLQLERQLERGHGREYDILAIDAFNSDSIPMHLLTAECGELYRLMLKDDGLLLLHVSNRNLDLRAVARGLARYLAVDAARITSARDPSRGVERASWMILARRDHPFFQVEEVAKAINEHGYGDRDVLWTDDFASLWSVLGIE